MTLPRTRRHATALLAGVALALTACAGTTPGANNETPTVSGDTFPVTVETAYGDITLDKKPERIIAFNVAAIDTLSELGAPVLAYPSRQGEASEEEMTDTYPWLEGRLTGTLDNNLMDASGLPNAEVIASYEPDLIIFGSYSGVDDAVYRQLSSIAPTYIGAVKDSADSWQHLLEVSGEMTGTQDSAAQALTQIEGEFAAMRERLPGLQGKTYRVAGYWEGTLNLYGEPTGWLDNLGLVSAEDTVELSLENLEQADSDVLFVFDFAADGNASELEADPRFAELPASKNGTLTFMDSAMWAARSENAPGAMRWTIENVGAALEASTVNGGA